ncbi:hypothetical protein GKE82_08520 [Conexibacter sp. W3-3-2]|uniref:LVIVD repeat-containing protein n=1 Tax=Conexibacter sp. W3-3-2 TaxID=2675227 RepID=UPI0012B9C4C9|nr:hypothetical protein [Conexibacter sp. W3-3-2]MTD44337.1 hypothetical protein [Conexibacter sp. W3-3-2]
MGRRALGLLLTIAAGAGAAPAAHAYQLGETGLRPSSLTRAQAAIPAAQPLTGMGQNMRIVGNLPLDTAGGNPAASDLELHGNFAFIGSYTEGMVIADVSDPTRPRRVGVFSCGGGSQYDVQLSTDGNLALLTTDSSGASCLPDGKQGSMVIDVTDRARPVLKSFIETAVGSHTHTLDGRTLYINNYPTSYSKLEIYDLTDPAVPAKLSELSFGGEDSIHDSYVDHRPDGRTLLYAASIGFTDVIDVTDPRSPRILQRLADPAVTISHQAEPNPARDTLVVTDELLGGTDVPVCGQLPVRLGEGILPVIGDPTDTGAIHFYKLERDGTMLDGGKGSGKIGTFNLPAALNPTGGCTVHVLWQAPDVNRLVAAWYGRGTHVVDYQDPAAPRLLGSFIPTGANTWAAKPHRVGGRSYVFTGDIARGMDVLEFTGDGWPATAGPAEAQRAQIQGAAPAPAATPTTPSRPPTPIAQAKGGYAFKARIRVPRALRTRTATLTLTFTDVRGKVLAKQRYRGTRGRVATLRARIAARAGRYRYVVRVGDTGRVLRRGTITVTRRKAVSAAERGGRAFVCTLPRGAGRA